MNERAHLLLAGIALLAAGDACISLSNNCKDELQYRTINLMDWCVGSGDCSYNGKAQPCAKAGSSYCEEICQYKNHQGYPDEASCMNWCLSSPDPSCPYLYAPIGSDMSWEYPLALLGSVREGLTVLDVVLGAGAGMGGVELRVSVGGQVVCTSKGALGAYSAAISCELQGSPASVRLDVIGDHPAFTPSPKLREPTPTQHVSICAM